jgi:CspA family cold shock protein
VKWFNASTGFGFIVQESGDVDMFVHIHDVEQAGLSVLRQDQVVSYEIYTQPDGQTKAANLKIEKSHASVSTAAPVCTGVIKWFNLIKGWGFIKPDDAGPDVFIHAAEIKNSCLSPEIFDVSDGKKMRVTYVVTEGRDGRPNARSISLVD